MHKADAPAWPLLAFVLRQDHLRAESESGQHPQTTGDVNPFACHRSHSGGRTDQRLSSVRVAVRAKSLELKAASSTNMAHLGRALQCALRRTSRCTSLCCQYEKVTGHVLRLRWVAGAVPQGRRVCGCCKKKASGKRRGTGISVLFLNCEARAPVATSMCSWILVAPTHCNLSNKRAPTSALASWPWSPQQLPPAARDRNRP